MAIPNPNPNIADGIKCDNKTYSSNKIEALISTATELPTPEEGDEGKLVAVNDDLGYTLDAPPVIPVIGSYSTEAIKFSDVTWTASGNGKYYTTIDLDSVLPEGVSIIGATCSGWSNLRTTDVLEIYIRTARTIGILSNVNTFADANASYSVTVIYK